MVEDPLTELLCTGARRLMEAALAAEFEECLSGFADERLPAGRQRVVRNGHLPRREILTGIGLDAAVPWVHLHGVSTGQMRAVVSALAGEEAARGLSANVVPGLPPGGRGLTLRGPASPFPAAIDAYPGRHGRAPPSRASGISRPLFRGRLSPDRSPIYCIGGYC